MSRKNVGHHSWPTDKSLGFEWPKTAQMAWQFLGFFKKYGQGFSCSSKQFLRTFFFLQGFVHESTVQFKMKPCRPCTNFR